MELLQKLTLYDLLGYTLPGITFLWVFISNGFLPELEQAQNDGAVFWCALIILGYITGIVIAEATELLGKIFEKIGLEKQYCKKIIEIYSISEIELKTALEKSKGTAIAQGSSAAGLLEQHRSYIYSDIQTDEKYSRLHNYASAELLYKNMTVVFATELIIAILQHEWPKVIVSIIAMVCFLFRFGKFQERKSGYAACWFIQKHLK